MSDEINYQNNPLHGLSLKNMLIELVDHYDFKILFAYLNINCFRSNPSIESSVKFLKKTEWARQKVEVFYLYEFKNLPRASSEQFALPPRDRVVPEGQAPREPAELSMEDAERLREKRERKAAERDAERNAGRNKEGGYQSRSSKPTPYSNNRSSGGSQDAYEPPATSSDNDAQPSSDPWAKWK